MFCINCGASLEQNGKYCPFCGQQVVNTQCSSNTTTSPSTELTAKLSKFIQPLQFIESNQSNYQYLLKCKAKKIKAKNSSKVVLALISPLIIPFILCVILAMYDIELEYGTIYFLLVFAFYILSVLYIIWLKHKAKKGKGKSIRYFDLQIETLVQKQKNILSMIIPDLTEMIPKEYWYSSSIISILTYIKNGKASSLQEAIPLYHEELLYLQNTNKKEYDDRLLKKQLVGFALEL